MLKRKIIQKNWLYALLLGGFFITASVPEIYASEMLDTVKHMGQTTCELGQDMFRMMKFIHVINTPQSRAVGSLVVLVFVGAAFFGFIQRKLMLALCISVCLVFAGATIFELFIQDGTCDFGAGSVPENAE